MKHSEQAPRAVCFVVDMILAVEGVKNWLALSFEFGNDNILIFVFVQELVD